MHYKRWRNHGDTAKLIHVRATCTVSECGRSAVGGGLCFKHYQRQRKHGDPNKLVRSPANQGHVFVGRKGYLYVAVGVRRYPLHRLIAEAVAGRPLASGEIVHHRDRNILNNDPANLEIMSNGAHTTLHHKTRPQKTSCKRGHPLNGNNLSIHASGARVCRTCKNARQRAYNQAKR